MKKYLFVFFLFIAFIGSVRAQQYRSPDYDAYIEKYSKIAVEQMKKHKIPASITLAQGLLESGAGKSHLATHGNNHFGIKCHGWDGKKQYHDDDENGECFRVYDSARESFEDHSLFLMKKRYERLFSYKITDYRSWAHGLKACGYATSPTYAQSLISIIERYELYRYDNGKYQPSNDAASGGKNDKKTDKNDKKPQHKEYDVKYNNGIPYVISQNGDTYKTLAWNLNKSCRKLAKYNECDADDPLTAGTVVYLAKKAKKGAKEYKGKVYVVKPGDTMYKISQYFAIRLKYLYRINGLAPDATISVGQRIYVR